MGKFESIGDKGNCLRIHLYDLNFGLVCFLAEHDMRIKLNNID